MKVLVDNKRPDYDELIQTLADYVMNKPLHSDLAFETAQYCLMDTLGCGVLALNYPECARLQGPWVEGQITPKGARVPGTSFEVDPVKAAFDIGTMIRWLDYNDTWLAAEWGHPSDNLGGILAVMDYSNRQGQSQYTVRDLLDAMIRAHEIQGVLALENSFNGVGLDHVVLVKVASTAVVTKLLGGTQHQVMQALSHAWLDGQSLRTYRHAPNTGSRKSWAAGDATSRAVRLSQMVLQGEDGYPSALSASRWGVQDVLFDGKPIKLAQELGSYVMENILFKIAYPAEFHGQTAVECAQYLRQEFQTIDDIESITLATQSSGYRIINKEGQLYNPADRDHCLQYMVAAMLVEGELTSESYTDKTAQNPAIDIVRSKMVVVEDESFSQDYLDPNKRSIANRVEIQLKNGQSLSKEIHYPVGHRQRREEGIPLLLEKFEHNLKSFYSSKQAQSLFSVCQDANVLGLKVDDFVEKWLV